MDDTDVPQYFRNGQPVTPDPATLAELDQRQTRVQDLMKSLIVGHSQIAVARHQGNHDRVGFLAREVVSRILDVEEPEDIVSLAFNLAAVCASAYIDHCGGIEKVVQNLESGVCQCGSSECGNEGISGLEKMFGK